MLSIQNVFIAEDDSDDQFFFSLAFKELCSTCSLDMSFDGEELLEKLENCLPQLPDLIILDINMPKLDGFQTLSLIRTHAALKNVPVIIYSTSSNHSIIKEAYEKGADYYMIKSRTFLKLKTELKKIVEGEVLQNKKSY